MHQKRDIVWVTEIDYTTESVGITTTVYVDADAMPATVAVATSSASASDSQPASSSSASGPSETPSVYVAPVLTTLATAASSTYLASSPVSAVSVEESSTYIAPATTSAYTEPTPSSSAISTSAVDTAPATTTSSAAAASTSASSSSGSVCSSDAPCEGDITFYTAGLGACGETNDGDSENVVALPFGLMGTQSNGNPYCGKTITISKNGKTTTATVVDKCMGCTGDSIDLSTKAFGELEDFAVGRTTAEWWFN